MIYLYPLSFVCQLSWSISYITYHISSVNTSILGLKQTLLHLRKCRNSFFKSVTPLMFRYFWLCLFPYFSFQIYLLLKLGCLSNIVSHSLDFTDCIPVGIVLFPVFLVSDRLRGLKKSFFDKNTVHSLM